MKKLKIGQYAKLLVVVLTMAFVAGACSSKDKDNTLVGTSWTATQGGATYLIKLTSGTNFTLTVTEGATVVNGQGTYTYDHPDIVFTITLTPALIPYLDPGSIAGSVAVSEGVVIGNTIVFDGMVFTKVS